jgi:lipopolysaccharide biosynthesis protein
MNQTLKARAIAFYLPQFHPIPENDTWWGKGFTDWINVAKAKPLFKGHYQPQLPADLGFYDLRVPEVREAQAELAREHGIEAFCYWHYWFAGERLLERPFQEVLKSGKPNFPFCLGWANHTWSGLWSGGDEKRIIKEQTYPGREDHQRHFEYLLTAFRDPRYVRVDGKPLLLIYEPLHLPESRATLDCWRELAQQAGLPGLHLVANLDYQERNWDARAHGFDAITVWTMERILAEARSCLWTSRVKAKLKGRKSRRLHHYVETLYPGLDRVYDYEEIRNLLVCRDKFQVVHHPMVIPNWDTTARYDRKAIIFHNSTPDAFRHHLRDVLSQVESQPAEQRIVFVKSWNEWAEGNYLEPDRRHGRAYLDVFSQELLNCQRIK